MPLLEVHELCKAYPPATPDGMAMQALNHLSFTCEPDAVTVLLGPASCGKSTLLHIAAGLDTADSGDMLLHGKDIRTEPSCRRPLVFSTQTMFPWLDVRKNIETGLRIQHLTRTDLQQRTDEAIRQTGLAGYEKHLACDIPPGLRQLTAIARALALEPDILLMDEPFNHLDAQTRLILQKQLLAMQREKSRAILFTTHDIDEAILLGDTIHLLTPRPGAVQNTIPVNIPHPRSHHAMMHPLFLQIKQQLMDVLLV